jgi:hypothetical protein
MNQHDRSLGEKIFYILSKYLEKQQSEEISLDILELIIELNNQTYKEVIEICYGYDKLLFEKYNDMPDIFKNGVTSTTKMMRYRMNSNINSNKDRLISILKTKVR